MPAHSLSLQRILSWSIVLFPCFFLALLGIPGILGLRLAGRSLSILSASVVFRGICFNGRVRNRIRALLCRLCSFLFLDLLIKLHGGREQVIYSHPRRAPSDITGVCRLLEMR